MAARVRSGRWPRSAGLRDELVAGYRPAGEGRWPVLLTRLPYGKDLPLGGAILDPIQAARTYPRALNGALLSAIFPAQHDDP